jgi:hypothetical protein
MILRKLNENLNEAEYLANIQKNREACIQYILAHQNGSTSSFPDECPEEINPYIGEVELQNYEKYVIGTFPPISYMLDNEKIKEAYISSIKKPVKGREKKPKVNYYHGNKGSMWDLLLGNEFFNFDSDNEYTRAEYALSTALSIRKDVITNFLL